jgi:glycosyltransferase involved in cell wall biosynthesis
MISIIIPSFNSELTIEKCLGSLCSQKNQSAEEIFLVDSSTDATPRIVREKFPQVKLIHLDQKTDPGTARNLGVRESKGELIAFIDSDCVAAEDWLEKISAAHRAGYRVAGGAVCNGNDPGNPVAWAGYMAEFREFLPEQPRREVPHIPTCNISYQRSVFDQYGLFANIYYPQEDLVFNTQLNRAGEAILFDPEIRVFHRHRTRLKDFLRHQAHIGRVTARVLRLFELEGSSIARHPWKVCLLLPVLPAVKFCRTLGVFGRLQPWTPLRHPIAVAILALGLAYWVAGFSREVFQGKGVAVGALMASETPIQSKRSGNS